MKKIQKPSSKMKLVKNRNFNTEFQIRNYTQQSSKRRYSIIPPKHGKNFYMLKKMTNSYNTIYNTVQSNNIMKKRRLKLQIQKQVLKMNQFILLILKFLLMIIIK